MNAATIHFKHEVWALIPDDPNGSKPRRIGDFESDEQSIESFRNFYRGKKLPVDGAVAIVISRRQPITTEHTTHD
jgi:hypothetical protein